MSKKKNILLVTASFYPQNKISVLRVGQWAKYWSLMGHRVTVLTCEKYSFLGPFGLKGDLPSNVRVIEVGFLPKFLQKRYAVDHDKVPVAQKKNTAVTKSNFGLNGLKIFVRKLRKYVGSLFDIHDLWVSNGIKVGEKLFQEEDFDLIVSSYSPPAAHCIASKLKVKNPEVVWLADFRDPWANNHIQPARGVFGWYETRKEKKAIDCIADFISTISDPLAADFQKFYPTIPILTINNGFDPDEFPDWANKLAKARDAIDILNIVYAGTIYPDRRDPSLLFKACNELIDEGVIEADQVVIDFYGNNSVELNNIMNKDDLNRYNIVKLHGFVSREISLNAQKNSDLLLLLEWDSPTAVGVLTGKLFEYLVSSVPILAVGINDRSSAGALIKETKTGVSHTELLEIKASILDIFIKKKCDFYSPDVTLIQKYSRKSQAQNILNKIFGE